MRLNQTGTGTTNMTLTVKEIISHIQSVKGGFASYLARREKAKPSDFKEKPFQFENKNVQLQDWLNAYDYLINHIRSTYGGEA